MATSLSSKSIGNPDNAFVWYLHSGGNATNTGAAALASGFQVALGDGAETPLWLDSGAVGIRSAGGFVSKLSSAATATRSVTLADSPGTLTPKLTATLASDVISSIVTPATVGSWSVALAPSKTYEFEILLIVSSISATNSPRVLLLGPAEIDYVYYELATNGFAGVAVGASWAAAITNSANPPGANIPYYMIIRGVCRTTSSTPSAAVQIQFFSEAAAASAVTLLRGSTMRFTAV